MWYVCYYLPLHLQAQQEVAQVHADMRSGHESKNLDPDGRIQKKEKKKKSKKVRIRNKESKENGTFM